MHRPEPSDAWVTRQSKKIEGGLSAIEGLLDGEPPTSVDPLHLGHIAVASTVLVWEFAVAKGLSPDIAEFRWRQRYPKLNFWVEEISKRRSFRLTEPDMMDVDIAAQMS